MLAASWTLDTVEKGLRSFNAENLGSVGERAAKLLAIKFENDSTPRKLNWFECGWGQVAGFSLDLQLWQLVTLQPFNLQSPKFQHQKI